VWGRVGVGGRVSALGVAPLARLAE
jgi:hypothetical protein